VVHLQKSLKILSKCTREIIKKLPYLDRNFKIFIGFDGDSDGFSSFVITYRLLKELGYKKIRFKVFNHEVKSIRKNFDVYVFLDIPTIPSELLTDFKEVIIIDHHPPNHKFKKFNYCNPRLVEENAYIPTSCIAYYIYKKLLESSDIVWVAGIGIIGDKGFKNCKWVFREIRKMYPELLGNCFEESCIFDTELGKLAKIVNSLRLVNSKLYEKFGKYFARLDTYKRLLEGKDKESKFLLQIYRKTEREIEKWLKIFETRKIETRNLVYLEVNSKFNIRSTLATILSEKIKTKVVAVGQREGKWFKVSFRNKNALKVLHYFLRNIPDSSGGGHPVACSMKFPAKYKKIFISKLK